MANCTNVTDFIPKIECTWEAGSASWHTVGYWMMYVIAIIGIIVGVIHVLFVVGSYVCGFTKSGVRASSAAAGYQSGIGDVEAGSCFAWCQSFGTGCCRWFVLIIGVGLVVGGTYLFIYTKDFGKNSSSVGN